VHYFCVYQAATADQTCSEQTRGTVVIDLEASDDPAVVTCSQVDTASSGPVSSSSSGCVEPVSAIVGKCLHRATTAPPTIRQFFKPRQPENNSSCAEPSSRSGPERSADDDDDVASGDNDDAESERIADAALAGDIDNDDDNGGTLDSDYDDDAFVAEKWFATKPGCLRPQPALLRTQVDSRKTATGGKLAAKRSGGSGGKLPAGKKARQSSIEALFTSAAGNRQKQLGGAMHCPICSRSFDETASNADVNRHIDSCLIE